MERDTQQHHEDAATLSPTQLIQLAETHLRVRNFSLGRQYALESQHNLTHNHSLHHRATQLAAIADILIATSAAPPGFINWYSVLQVDTFSDNQALIRSQFKKLLLLLDKESLPLVNEASEFVWKAYNCLSNDAHKSQLDSQLALLLSNQKHVNNGGCDDGGEASNASFWTFCPYCFYIYQYARVFEGCCLRCQNETCRRAFHGVPVNSLPRMDLEKGQYFSCFGYFPLGISPSECEGKGKFASWSPIVGLFPVKRIGKTCARRTDFDGNDDENDHVVEILDDSDESESPVYDNEAGGNVGLNNMGVPGVEKPRMMRRKSVAWNTKKLMGRGRRNGEGGYGAGERLDSDDEGDEDGVTGFDNYMHGVAGPSSDGVGADDVKFFEEDGEIFVNLGPDDAF